MSATLSPSELALKLATREAVKAAGGQVFVGGEVGRTQSRMSDYESPDKREFMPIDVVHKVEALGVGSPGHPHITRALARAQSLKIGGRLPHHDNANLADWLCDLTGESADVIRALVDGAVQPGSAGISLQSMPRAARERLSREIDQAIDVFVAFKAEAERGE